MFDLLVIVTTYNLLTSYHRAALSRTQPAMKEMK